LRTRYRDGWFKVSRRIVDSSLWAEDPVVLKVWLFLLEQSQAGVSLKPGTVIISRQILAARCLLSAEQLDLALGRLSAPDPESRTTRKEGRRIEILPNGFRLVNHGEYHDVVADEARSKARSHAGRVGGLRSGEARKLKSNQPDSQQQSPTVCEPKSNQTETEKETKKETEKNGSAPAVPRPAWTGDPDTDADITALGAAVREIAALESGDERAIMREITGANGKGKPVGRADLLRGGGALPEPA
jgi:hypothetical protein